MNAENILARVCMAMWVSETAIRAFEANHSLYKLTKSRFAKRRSLYWKTRAVVVHDRALAEIFKELP